jgi:hypothetical protein
MKNATVLLALVVLAGGCRTARNDMYRGTFSFVYEGATYEIISLVLPADRGGNSLLLREGNRLVLHARDQDQDGTLDTLLVGDVTLESANDIYAHGIADAQAQGKYQEQVMARQYALSRSGYTYVIQTYLLDAGALSNRFILLDAVTRRETVLLDTDADGVLDEVERGEADLEASQKFCDLALKKGIRAGRIARTGTTYAVKPTMQHRRPL